MSAATRTSTELALKALDDVVRRFPDSKYARDAKLKLDFTRDHLAGKEMEIGRYYLKRGEYLAAMNRFKRVIDNYQTTTHVPEALERLVECDLALGLTKEAKENAAVLGYNYPGSHWYQDAYALVTGSGSGPTEARQGWFGTARSAASEPRHITKKLISLAAAGALCRRADRHSPSSLSCRAEQARRAPWWIWRQHPGGFSA